MFKREDKGRLVKEFHDKFASAEGAFITEYQGLKVRDMTALRKSLRGTGVEFRVLKNTLAIKAVKDTPYESLSGHFTGVTAVAISYKDPAMMAKVLMGFVKNQPNLKIKVGALKARLLQAPEIKYLAELPSREELLAKFLGVLKNVPGGLVLTLAAVPRKLLYALNAVKNAKEATPA